MKHAVFDKISRTARAGLAIAGAALLLAGCAGSRIDWAGVGAGVTDRACKNSSHCDLPCGRDSKRPDCVGDHDR
jgi:hypothetical protein